MHLLHSTYQKDHLQHMMILVVGKIQGSENFFLCHRAMGTYAIPPAINSILRYLPHSELELYVPCAVQPIRKDHLQHMMILVVGKNWGIRKLNV